MAQHRRSNQRFAFYFSKVMCSQVAYSLSKCVTTTYEKVVRMQGLEIYFVIWAFFFQGLLIVHFALRKWAFEPYVMKIGWIVYALGLPSALLSIWFLLGGLTWSLWTGGFIYLVWALYGYHIDYRVKTPWRSPINWRIFGPYVTLYLATIMFYWWPLGLIDRSYWMVYAGLFVISTVLNVTSHKNPGRQHERKKLTGI